MSLEPSEVHVEVAHGPARRTGRCAPGRASTATPLHAIAISGLVRPLPTPAATRCAEERLRRSVLGIASPLRSVARSRSRSRSAEIAVRRRSKNIGWLVHAPTVEQLHRRSFGRLERRAIGAPTSDRAGRAVRAPSASEDSEHVVDLARRCACEVCSRHSLRARAGRITSTLRPVAIGARTTSHAVVDRTRAPRTTAQRRAVAVTRQGDRVFRSAERMVVSGVPMLMSAPEREAAVAVGEPGGAERGRRSVTSAAGHAVDVHQLDLAQCARPSPASRALRSSLAGFVGEGHESVAAFEVGHQLAVGEHDDAPAGPPGGPAVSGHGSDAP